MDLPEKAKRAPSAPVWNQSFPSPKYRIYVADGTLHSYTYNGRPIESRIWSIEWRYFQWPWTTTTHSFKVTPNIVDLLYLVTPFFDAEYVRNGMRYRHSVIEILIGTYTRLTQQCHFEWPWVILSDLAKSSMTWSIARSVCDSWASCWHMSSAEIQK